MENTRLRFQDLISDGGIEEDAHLTRGQMLLLGLNGLFEKIESNLITLANQLKNPEIPDPSCEIIENARKRMVKLG